jgi:hypothetical protein
MQSDAMEMDQVEAEAEVHLEVMVEQAVGNMMMVPTIFPSQAVVAAVVVAFPLTHLPLGVVGLGLVGLDFLILVEQVALVAEQAVGLQGPMEL